MKFLKQRHYLQIIIAFHLLLWAICLYFFKGPYVELQSQAPLAGDFVNTEGINIYRIIGEILSTFAITAFGFNLFMSTKAKWVEKLFGGLDKMYMVHRRTAIIASIAIILHFIVVPRDKTVPGPFVLDMGLGNVLGIAAILLILIGVIISALPYFKRVLKYDKWLKTHKFMGVFYLFAVVHAFLVPSLIKELPLVSAYVFVVSILGVGAWVYKAFFYAYFNPKLDYTVISSESVNDDTSVIVLKPVNQRLRFVAGQFSFVEFPTISKGEEHPFSISSKPSDEIMRFHIKGLGDYTNGLADRLKPGDPAKVEGPFGHFTNQYIDKLDQIWIAGGIGIAPFLSMANDITNEKVKLFYCVATPDQANNVDELEALAAKNPNFEFILWDSDAKDFLNADKLGISDFNKYGYLMCGPAGLKQSLTKQLKKKGVSDKEIYEEEFGFR